MKITQAALKAIIQEEVANMFEAADKNTGMSGVKGDDDDDTYMGHEKADALDEDGGAFAPSHYCVHHGGVQHEGKIRMAEAVSHNYNRKLGRVTHYNMQLSDGTILENVAAEDIQVTDASLAEGHDHPVGKRDDEEVDEGLFGGGARKDIGAMKKRLVMDILDELEEHFAGTESADFVANRVRLAKGTLERL